MLGGDRACILPDDSQAERSGGRRIDLAFVCFEGQAGSLDEASIRSRGPHCRRGANDCLGFCPRHRDKDRGSRAFPQVGGRAGGRSVQAWDRLGETAALVDLGFAVMQEGNVPRATEILEGAAGMARGCGDAAREADANLYLGTVLVLGGQDGRGLGLLEVVRDRAARSGDRFGEKLALEKLGLARGVAGDPAGALEAFAQAVAVAQAVGQEPQRPSLAAIGRGRAGLSGGLVGVDQAWSRWRSSAVSVTRYVFMAEPPGPPIRTDLSSPRKANRSLY